MRIMSFDVSSVSTGWALFDNNRLKSYGLITRSSIYDFSTVQKLFIFKNDAEKLLIKYKPDLVVIEETYMKNVKTLKTLMQFIGVLQITCYELLDCLQPIFISPNTVRSYFKVRTKEDAFEFVIKKYAKRLKHLDFKSGNDIADAALMGLYLIEIKKKGIEDEKSKE